jgi:hypothetical protein
VGSTECPGSRFYATLPAIRSDVVARVDAASAYARPKGASPVRVPLVPAFAPCSAPDTVHGGPLAAGSCRSPRQQSSYLTVGTPDSNGFDAASTGSLRLDVAAGDPSTAADEADVRISAAITDVRERSDLSDYAGELRGEVNLRITDRWSGSSGSDPATVTDTPLRVTIACGSTADAAGGRCAVTTTADAVVPGVVPEGSRAIWQLGPVEVYDGGADGVATTTGDNSLFADQGLFVP